MSVQNILKSWETTLAGILAFVAIVSVQVGFAFDTDPLTKIDWSVVVSAAGVLWLGLTARDGKVTSEQAGASKKK